MIRSKLILIFFIDLILIIVLIGVWFLFIPLYFIKGKRQFRTKSLSWLSRTKLSIINHIKAKLILNAKV